MQYTFQTTVSEKLQLHTATHNGFVERNNCNRKQEIVTVKLSKLESKTTVLLALVSSRCLHFICFASEELVFAKSSFLPWSAQWDQQGSHRPQSPAPHYVTTSTAESDYSMSQLYVFSVMNGSHKWGCS